MNKLMKEACAISDSCNNAIVLSIAWSGAARFIKNFTVAGKKELDVFLALCNAATLNNAAEITVTADDILTRIKSDPVPSILTANQKKRMLKAGKTEAQIKSERMFAFDKNMAKHRVAMRLLHANEDAIRTALTVALTTPPTNKKVSQLGASIIAQKVFIKLSERDSVLTDLINTGIRVDLSEQEQDVIWDFIDDNFEKNGALIAA